MKALVRFNDFEAFLDGKTVLRAAVKPPHYEVEYYAPRPAQNDLFALPAASSQSDDDPTSPPRFTFDTDPIGCERRALAWGRKK